MPTHDSDDPARSATMPPELERDREFAQLAKALGHPARVAILRLLLRRDSCVCGEIVDEIPLAQSTVSQHLRQLKDAGLIRGELDPPRVCYCVDPATVRRLQDLVADLAELVPASITPQR
ncbi:MAG: winged helix-turn-helix transcriptional regulator [Gemmatimonadetes bacterium]|nr:winged helix-turn-helix transcriptional regulator [Gemmatimonadota bacterium]